MKVSTLIHIHKLLIEEETRKLLLKNAALRERNEAEEDSPEWDDLHAKYKEANREWEDAHNARIDFEEREW